MTKFAYYIRKDENSDHSHSVKIRMTHGRKTKFFPTSIYVLKSQISRDGKSVRDGRIERLLQDMVRQYEDAFLTIRAPQFYSIDDLAAAITERMNNSEGFRLDFFEYAERKMGEMNPKTAEGYRTAMSAVRRFAKKDRLDINEISAKWVTDFKRFLETEPPVKNGSGTYRTKSAGSRAVSYYLGCVRALHNAACDEFNDYDTNNVPIAKKPFAKRGIVPSMPKTEHRTLSAEQLKAIFFCEPKQGSRSELARDVFFISFCLCGTNTVDIFNLAKDDLRGELLTYHRAKTDSTTLNGAKVTMAVLPELQPMIEKWGDVRGRRLFAFYRRYSNAHEFNRACNIGLKNVAKLCGIDELNTYYARHSWATIARNECHVDQHTVAAALVHSPMDRITDIYLAPDYRQIWKAQREVMDFVMKNKSAEIVAM